MISRISNVQTQPNRIQAQNKHAKPAFGNSSYINSAEEVAKLLPKSEFDAMYKLLQQVIAGDYKFKNAVDPAKASFVNSTGDSLVIQNQAKEINPSIVLESADKADKFIFNKTQDDESYIKAVYNTLTDELNKLIPNKNK